MRRRTEFVWYVHGTIHIMSDCLNEGVPALGEQWLMLPFDGWDCD